MSVREVTFEELLAILRTPPEHARRHQRDGDCLGAGLQESKAHFSLRNRYERS